MSLYLLESKLKRSKSTGALDAIDPHCNDSELMRSFVNYCRERDESARHETLLDSLNKSNSRILDLEQNNQKLRGMMEQHQNILRIIKEDTRISYRNIIAELLEDSLKTMEEVGNISEDIDKSETSQNKQAQSLLAAIAPKRADVDMKDALEKLETKWRNDVSSSDRRPLLDNLGIDKLKKELRKRVAAVQNKQLSLKELGKAQPPDVAWESLKRTFNKDTGGKMSSGEGWNFRSEKFNLDLKRRDFFRESVESCQLKFDPLSLETEYTYAEEHKVPPSPTQPADPEVSIIDHLMQTAVINKKISEGDLNGSFEEALSRCNLALVVGACRAVDPGRVFSPCSLSQAVLLSLVQQLATDMVHDTQLKCRYLEEALINLDVSDEVTQKHLPVVVGEVRKHLSKFVRVYPHHVANRRISLIIMAADNLIK